MSIPIHFTQQTHILSQHEWLTHLRPSYCSFFLSLWMNKTGPTTVSAAFYLAHGAKAEGWEMYVLVWSKSMLMPHDSQIPGLSQ